MKKLILTLFALVLIAPLSLAQEKQEPEFKLVEFHMALVKKGPKWSAEKTPETAEIQKQHVAYVMSLLGSGKAVVAGPMGDDAGILGVFIFRAKSAEEAKAWADEDPAVKAGRHTNEMHPWWSEDVFKKANEPMKLGQVFLAFLKRGPNRKAGDGETPEVKELQKAHLANIQRLAKEGKIVVAGPFGDNGELRGIFVFRVASLQEAQELCASDPMIKINRLAADIHPWMVPDGMLP